MVNLGVIAQRVNSQKYEVLIGASGDNLVLLQNASLSVSHSEFREPTTGGSNVYFSGAPDNVLSGTILYTSDLVSGGGTGGDINEWLTRTNGEYSLFTIVVRLTNAGGTAQTYTFTSGAKLTSLVIYKGAEGATKADVTFILSGDPVIA